MMEHVVRVLDGPDKSALQWAVAYPERGQTVTFKLEGNTVEASISEMEEIAGFDASACWPT